MKHLHIFKDYSSKSSIKLFKYSHNISIFESFLLASNNHEQFEDKMNLTYTNGYNVLDVEQSKRPYLENFKLYLTHISGQIVLNIKKLEQFFFNLV